MSDISQAIASIEHIGENLVKLTFDIEPTEFEKAMEHAYIKNKSKINLPGFRKGRAPRKMIEVQFGRDVFYDDAVDYIFGPIYQEAIKEHKLEVVSTPTVDIKEKDGKTTIYAEVYTKPIVEIEDYKGISYTKQSIEVTQEEIDAEIEKQRQNNARIQNITEGAAESGDTVKIDFEGFIDGVAFDNGKAEGFELVLGSKSFIDTFEDQIVGKSIGDSFEVNVNFPEQYHALDLAGKPAMFKVNLHEITRKQLPEVNDDFAQEVSEFDTLQEYKESIGAEITKSKESNAQSNMEIELLDGLCERISVNIPKPMIDNEAGRLLRDFANRVQSQGVDFQEYMQMTGMDIDRLRAMFQNQANQNILNRLALEAVAKKEDIQISDEEYNQEIDRLSQAYKMEKEELLKALGEDEDEVNAIKDDMKVRKALDLVKAAAVVKEEEAKEEKEAKEESN